MPTVHFVNEKKQVEVPDGANLREAAIKAGVSLYPHVHKLLNCHGFGMCGSCRVLIKKGQESASPMGAMEKFRFHYVPDHVPMAYVGHENEMRLACKVAVHGDMEIVTQPPLNWFGENFFS
jgi:ferredoxin